MANGVLKETGERIVPALRYRNAKAAIDWLCKAFGFAKKMVVPGEGDSIAHAELTLGNGMIMLVDVETEYGHLVAAPLKGQSVTKDSMWSSPTSMAITPAPRRKVPRSCSSSRRKIMAGGTIPAATSKVMSGPSALTIPG
jgi:Glyoxalase/Bleomycin resistance protein/Dioxygenase superfamily